MSEKQDQYYRDLKWEGDRDDMILSGDASRRLSKALILTGMMNGKFISQIATNQVSEEYVTQAFENFRRAQNPPPKKVQVEYVLGFMFSPDEKKVLLIWKNRPSWQAGKLNGIGGKVNPGETPLEAMEREFIEETGFVAKHYVDLTDEFLVPPSDNGIRPDWRLVGCRGRAALYDEQPGSYHMHIFACHFDTQIVDLDVGMHDWQDEGGTYFVQGEVREDTSEEVVNLPYNLEIIRSRGVPGLAWTAELARCALHENFLTDVHDPLNLEDAA